MSHRSEGEATPTVTFSATRLPLDEGGTDTVAILADGKLGTEVGSVMVSVSGDAVLSLWQDGDMLEAGDDGMYAVDLGDSANTILTVMADDDPALDDGMTATATVTIESANGADIGTRNSLAVTVSGLTQETDPDAPDPHFAFLSVPECSGRGTVLPARARRFFGEWRLRCPFAAFLRS